MRYFKNILLISILLSASIFGDAHSKLSWGKIETRINESLSFVSGKSKNNYWVQTKSGKLINVKNGEVIHHPIPSGMDFIKTQYFHISDDEFFCAATNSDWEGEIYKIKNGVWEKYESKSLAPFGFFVETLDHQIYLYGDFGILFKFESNKWISVKTPIESHFISAVVFGENIYFTSRGDGVLKFDGIHFTKLSSPERNDFITELKIIDENVFGFSIKNKLYSYYNDVEKRVINSEIEKIFLPEKIESQFGFSHRIVFSDNKKIEIDFPQSYNIFSSVSMDDGSIILLSKDGNIYFGENRKEISFLDFATIYRIDDLPFSKSNGSQFFDANNDGILDLLVLNNSSGNYISFYQGVKNSAFANITSLTKLPFNENLISFFTIFDFNKDNLSDIIFESKVDSLRKLLIYRNIGEFQFEKFIAIILPKDFQVMGIRNLSAFDYDKDGDDDIIVTSYYGYNDEPGYVLIYKNNYWGNFDEIDTTFKLITRKWNEKIIFSDISNNDTLDFFNTTYWKSDNLYFGTDSGFVNKSLTNFVVQKKTETINALLSDFDNDADLDIITVGRGDFIRIYSNDGTGNFTETTNSKFDKSFLNNPKIRGTHNLNLGDFNNDGFVDILVSIATSDSIYSTFFLNHKGEKFTENHFCFIKSKNIIINSSIADFDKDGDLDIYCCQNGHNSFLINRLDRNNSISIKLNGIVSSTNALGSKVWVYKKGKLDSINYLIGFKELGTESISKNSVNDLSLHFGLGEVKYCDIKIQFLSGTTIIRKNIKSGSELVINELPIISAFFYNIPRSVYSFVTNTENQIYFSVILFSHIILIIGLWYGFNKLNWSPKLTIIFTILNITLFWGSLYVSSFSKSDLFKFSIPLLLTVTITVIPLTLFFWLKKSGNKSIAAYNDKLLELIISFSHGEWALRNLNSIILFCENRPNNWRSNKEFQSKLNIRLETFLSMTSSSIFEIIEYEKLIGIKSDELIVLESTAKETEQIIKGADVVELSLSKLAVNFSIIRTNIKEIRKNIYARYSSMPTEVINNLIENFESSLKENEISVKKTKLYPQEIPVLIKGYELANIIDNLFQNSIRFMNDSKKRNITIELYKESPKIIIKFSNNGSSIDKGKWEVIFEHGYSEGGSTGQGLFSARELLKKYGGRIYVDVSNSEITTFKIELNEGINLS